MKKNILLIGGSHGIGLALAKILSVDYNVIVASRTNDLLVDMNITHLPFDATKDELDLDSLPEELHGFAYCPGSINLKPFRMLNVESFAKDMEINFFSMVRVVKDIIPKMADKSAMIFFSTVAVGTGMPYHASIAAAKGAVEGFAKSIAAEYAPRIAANVIAPSLVDTPLAGRLLNNEKKKDLMAERHPLKKIGAANDIAQMAAFLLRQDSSWITGQIIGVDGGLSTLNTN